jgi:poly(hydroxyalkanoate) depolymerase family esterase
LRKISDTIARLAALQTQHAAHSGNHDGQDHLAALAGFGPNPGALSGKFYLPVDLPKGSPLVVVLHGCTQTAAGYDHHSGWSKLADEEGFALLFPEQQRANNPNLCFNWFQPGDTRRDSGEVLSIRQMVEAMIVTHGIDRKRVFVTGLSAGGAMAAAMLATYPEVFAGGAIIAGLPFGSAMTVPEAFDRMRGHGGPSDRDLQRVLRRASDYQGPWPRISIWHGSADQTVAPSNAASIAGQWLGVHQLDEKPTYSQRLGPFEKRIWCTPLGDVVIEINMIAGMGHGTPLGNDGLGNPGPYMLDVGVSSTQKIAQFWGIAHPESKGFSRPIRLIGKQAVAVCRAEGVEGHGDKRQVLP